MAGDTASELTLQEVQRALVFGAAKEANVSSRVISSVVPSRRVST